MQTLGIIGGLGPETTSQFYLSIIAECQRLSRSHRPNIFINSVPILYTLEEQALLHGKDVEKCLPLLLHSARMLELAGAELIVMPCNTLHRFTEDIRAAVTVPFLSIVDVVAQYLVKNATHEVGLIATGITLEAGFYQNAFLKHGISCHTPTPFQQAKIAKLIYRLVSGSYANHHRAELIESIEDFFQKGLKTTLLACTDLQALIPHHPQMKIVDTMQLLADATVLEICGDTSSNLRI